MIFFGYFIALIIGLILGLIGGGGAILTIPLLEYFFNIPIDEGTSYSLFIIGVGALVGTIQRRKFLSSYIKPALIFVIPSTIVAALIRLFVMPNLPDTWQFYHFTIYKSILFTSIFLALMIYIAIHILRQKENKTAITSTYNVKIILFYALFTGLLSGLLGAGGGFIIVPVFMKMGMNMKKAIGISLVIITIQNLIAFGADIGSQLYNHAFFINLNLLFILTVLTIIGTLIGTSIQKRIPTQKLKLFFALLLLIVSLGIMVDRFII